MDYIAQQFYKLDIVPDSGWVVVFASQNDNVAREVNFKIYNQGKAFEIPQGLNVVVQGIKPNKGYFVHNCTYSGNVVKMKIYNDMSDIVGKSFCVLKFTDVNSNQLATAKFVLAVGDDASPEDIIVDTSAAEIFVQMLIEITSQAAGINADIESLKSLVGSPLIASQYSEMVDKSKIYIYTGSEAGYVFGNWYYWDGSNWTSGGIYNSVAVNTDKTLSVEDMPADGKAVGDRFNSIQLDINNIREYSSDSEAWAVGKRDGEDVDEEDETYHNNSKYYSESAESFKDSALQAVQAASQYATQAARDANIASTAATSVAGSETRAKRYAQDAEVDANRAEMAAKNAGYFDVEVDARGRLIYKRTEQVNTDLSIDTSGHLIMEIE